MFIVDCEQVDVDWEINWKKYLRLCEGGNILGKVTKILISVLPGTDLIHGID